MRLLPGIDAGGEPGDPGVAGVDQPLAEVPARPAVGLAEDDDGRRRVAAGQRRHLREQVLLALGRQVVPRPAPGIQAAPGIERCVGSHTASLGEVRRPDRRRPDVDQDRPLGDHRLERREVEHAGAAEGRGRRGAERRRCGSRRAPAAGPRRARRRRAPRRRSAARRASGSIGHLRRREVLGPALARAVGDRRR